MKQTVKLLLITTTLLLLIACGDDTLSNDKIDDSQYTLSSINYQDAYIGVGEAIQLIAYGVDVDTSELVNITDSVIWKSLDTSIATVNSNGLLTAKSKGITTILAELDDGSVELIVEIMHPYIYEVRLTPSEKTINVGDTFTFSGKRIWTDGSIDEVPLCSSSLLYTAWSSNDEIIAPIDCNGTVTGLSKGTVEISAFWRGDQPDLPTPKTGVSKLIVK